MNSAVQLPIFDPYTPAHGVGARPHISIELLATGQPVTAVALLDTGASVNVLPYSLGQQLGFRWEEQTIDLQLSGNLAQFPARAVAMQIVIPGLAPALQVFAWTQSPNVPLILGQANFFQEYDVCFFHSRKVVEIRPKT